MMSQVATNQMPMTGRLAALRLQLVAAEYVQRMGTRIRERRDELGLTRDQVAREIGGSTSGNDVYRWETGKHRPRDSSLEDLARVLRVEVAYFHADGPTRALGADEPTEPGQLDRIEAKLDAIIDAFAAGATDLAGDAREQEVRRAWLSFAKAFSDLAQHAEAARQEQRTATHGRS